MHMCKNKIACFSNKTSGDLLFVIFLHGYEHSRVSCVLHFYEKDEFKERFYFLHAIKLFYNVVF